MTSIAAAAAAAALDTLAQLMPGAPRLLLLVIPLTVLVLIGAAQLLQEEDRSRAEAATVVVIGAPNDLDLAGLVDTLSAADLRHLGAQLNARLSTATPEIRTIAARGDDELAALIPLPRQETRQKGRLVRSGRHALRRGTDAGSGIGRVQALSQASVSR